MNDASSIDNSSVINSMLSSDSNVPINSNGPDSDHLQTNANIMDTSASPVEEAPSDNINMNDSDLGPSRQDGSTFSDDCEEAETSQPSRFHTRSEVLSEGRITTESEESTTTMLPIIRRGFSDYADSEGEQLSSPGSPSFPGSPGSPESEPYYSRFRNSGPDLMTRHMFTGRFKGQNPVYVPMYKRDQSGKLMKLKEGSFRRWQYTVMGKLSEDEMEAGLKMFEEPEAAANRRRMLADSLSLRLPEAGDDAGGQKDY